MKDLFIAFILIVSHSLSAYAGERIITLTEQDIEDKLIWGEDARSITPPPTVTYEEKIIYIYSDALFESIKITIKDYNNHIIYSSLITISNNHKTAIMLNAIKGNYIIELTYKQTNYWGIIELKE